MEITNTPKFQEGSIVIYENEKQSGLVGTVKGLSIFPSDIVYVIENADTHNLDYVSEVYMMTHQEYVEGFSKISDGLAVKIAIDSKEFAKTVSGYLSEPKPDSVYHPSHYNQYSIEVIQLIKEATVDLKGIQAVCLGNVLKYLLRFQYKGKPLEDLEKAYNYLGILIEEYKENNLEE